MAEGEMTPDQQQRFQKADTAITIGLGLGFFGMLLLLLHFGNWQGEPKQLEILKLMKFGVLVPVFIALTAFPKLGPKLKSIALLASLPAAIATFFFPEPIVSSFATVTLVKAAKEHASTPPQDSVIKTGVLPQYVPDPSISTIIRQLDLRNINVDTWASPFGPLGAGGETNMLSECSLSQIKPCIQHVIFLQEAFIRELSDAKAFSDRSPNTTLRLYIKELTLSCPDFTWSISATIKSTNGKTIDVSAMRVAEDSTKAKSCQAFSSEFTAVSQKFIESTLRHENFATLLGPASK